MKSDVITRLHDARLACDEIVELTQGVSDDDYRKNRLLRLSVWKLLEVVGEALRKAERLEPELKDSIPDLRKIIDTRNRITHGYDSIDFDLVLTICRDEIPGLSSRLSDLLDNAPYITPGSWAGA